jgi:hypothetical protein
MHFADGEVVWSWRPLAGVKSVEDDRQATVTKKSWTPGRARSSVNTIAQGMFWRKNALNINMLWLLCRRLCRDPQKRLIAVKNSGAGRWYVRGPAWFLGSGDRQRTHGRRWLRSRAMCSRSLGPTLPATLPRTRGDHPAQARLAHARTAGASSPHGHQITRNHFWQFDPGLG